MKINFEFGLHNTKKKFNTESKKKIKTNLDRKEFKVSRCSKETLVCKHTRHNCFQSKRRRSTLSGFVFFSRRVLKCDCESTSNLTSFPPAWKIDIGWMERRFKKWSVSFAQMIFFLSAFFCEKNL